MVVSVQRGPADPVDVDMRGNIDTTITLLREKMQRIEGRESSVNLQHSAPIASGNDGSGVAPAPSWLAPYLRGGGFPRAAATQMSVCPAVLVDILASVTAHGGCAAVVNHPRLALAAVEAVGGDLERLVIVPDASPHVAAVVATLAEGMDMVMFNAAVDANARGELHSGFTRPVDARVSKSHCALLVSGAQWSSARHHVEANVHAVHGLGWGSGRVRGIEVAGTTWGRAQPPQRFRATIGSDAKQGYEWVGAESPARSQNVEAPVRHTRMAQ